MAGNVIVHSLRQRAIPSHLLGRVTSAYRLVGLGALPAGAAVGGLTAAAFGLPAPFWLAAAGSILLALTVGRVLTTKAIIATATLAPAPIAEAGYR